MASVTREKIAEMLKAKIGISKLICEEVVECVFRSMLEIIKTEEKLVLQNFGSFSIKHKKARPGQNLQTKTQIIIPPRNVIRFVPAKQLKSRINK